MGEQGIGRRELLAGMGAGTVGAVAALGVGMTPVWAKESEGRVEGSWQAVIHVEQPPDKAVTFPAMFGFAGGGVVTRVDFTGSYAMVAAHCYGLATIIPSSGPTTHFDLVPIGWTNGGIPNRIRFVETDSHGIGTLVADAF